MQFSRKSQTEDRNAAAGRLRDCRRLSERLFTIGHSHHEIERFVALLRGAGVSAVADVRSSPFSARLPQYNQSELRQSLESHGIAYIFLGDELGGRPRDPAVYDGDGRVDYWRVRSTTIFRGGVERLLREIDQYAIALACAEEDPLDCHRGLMIGPELIARGICPRHIRGNESIETTAQLESRLFEITGVGGGMMNGLFAASIAATERAELLDEAYREQARRKAFRLPPGEDFAAIGNIEEFSAE